MPKMKTKKSVAKRVKVTARGKLKYRKAGTGHLKSRKSAWQLRSYRKEHEVPAQYTRQVKRMLGL